MKKFLCLLLILVLCISTTSCKKSNKTENIVEPPLAEVNVVYDINGNMIQQILFNELSNDYIIKEYSYNYKYKKWTCYNQRTTVVKADEYKNAGHCIPIIDPSINIYYKDELANGPIVLIDNEVVKISIVEYLNKASWWEFGYKLKIENRSNKIITSLVNNAAIMSINCDPLFNVEHIEPGHTAYLTIAWDRETLERCWIPYIDNIEFILQVYNNDAWNTPALCGTNILIKHEN